MGNNQEEEGKVEQEEDKEEEEEGDKEEEEVDKEEDKMGGEEAKAGGGRGGQRGRRRATISDEIWAMIIDHVLSHGLTMRGAGLRVQPNLSRFTVASILRTFRNEDR